MADTLQSLFASIIVYTVGILLTKLSILQQFLRISAPGRTRKAIYAVVVLVCLAALATLLSCILSCHPVAYFWDSSIPGGSCLNEEALYLANEGINTATDLLLLIIPVFLLKDLAISRLQKIFLIDIISPKGAYVYCTCFRSNLFRSQADDFYRACIASIIRLPTLITIFQRLISSGMVPVLQSGLSFSSTSVSSAPRSAPFDHYFPASIQETSHLALVLLQQTSQALAPSEVR